MHRPSITIRTSIPSDYAKVLSVVLDWWDGRDLRSNVQRIFFDHFGDTVLVAEDDDKLAGFLIGFCSQSKSDEAFIHLVGVSPDLRGIGLGRQLYNRFMGICGEQGRTVFRACTSIVNRDSIEFHKRLGFSLEPGDAQIEAIPVSYGYLSRENPMVLFVMDCGTQPQEER